MNFRLNDALLIIHLQSFHSACSYQNSSCLSCLSLVGDVPKAVIVCGLGFLAIVFSAIIGAVVYKQTRKMKTSHNNARNIPMTSHNCAQPDARDLLAHKDSVGIRKHRQSSNSDVELETYPAETIWKTRVLEPEQNRTPDSRPINSFRTNSTLSFPHAVPNTPLTPSSLHQCTNRTTQSYTMPIQISTSSRGAVPVCQLASNPQSKTFLRTWRATTTSNTTTIEIGTLCVCMCVCVLLQHSRMLFN